MNKLIAGTIILMIIAVLYWFIKDHELEKDKIFYSIDDFPKFKLLNDNWKIIKDEIPKFDEMTLNKKLQRNIGTWDTDHNQELLRLVNENVDWVTGWSKNWFHYPIIYMGKPIKNIEKILPKTYNILKQLPSIHVAGFSLLKPNSTLGWHADETGKETSSLAINFGLDCDDSVLHVRDKNNPNNIWKIRQKNNDFIIFDSNYEHQVVNSSKTNYRVILYIDFKTNK